MTTDTVDTARVLASFGQNQKDLRRSLSNFRLSKDIFKTKFNHFSFKITKLKFHFEIQTWKDS